MATWEPNETGLAQLLELLRDSQRATSRHREIHERLQTFNSEVPDYNCYLAFIMWQCVNEPANVRQVAALTLKTNTGRFFRHWEPVHQEYVKLATLHGITLHERRIRLAAGTVASHIVKEGKLRAWPELLPALAQMLASNDEFAIEGALDTISKLCEDAAHELEDAALGNPLNDLVPRLLQFFSSPSEAHRKYAVGSLNHLIIFSPVALMANMAGYLEGLFALANDPSFQVRKRVCQGLVLLAEIRPEVLEPNIEGVVNFMLHATRDEQEDVAVEACEFWSTVCDKGDWAINVLRPFLPEVVPALLAGMVYSDMDLMLMCADVEEDDSVPDRPEDIRPVFASGRTHTAAHQDAVGTGVGAHGAAAGQAAAAEEEEEDDDVDDMLDDFSEWNLRKCSAAGLDVMSTVFGDELLPHLLGPLNACLSHSEWQVRESGVLALGAIAEGCYNAMLEHLPQLMGFLLTQLHDSKPLMRSITCWTTSRYARWICQTGGDLFSQVLAQLLERVLDRNKKVQEAACSAFATLEEEAGPALVPYLDPILNTLLAALFRYQARNLMIVYDALGCLADAAGQALNEPKYLEKLIPALISKWNALPDDNRGLFPLLECLTSVAQALRLGFQPYAEPVFQRCLSIVSGTLIMQASCDEQGLEGPDKDFIVCALDLISGLAEGLQGSFEALMGDTTLLNLVFQCMNDPAPAVRQSAFALVGDLAKTCMNQLLPAVEQFMPILIGNLDANYVSVCNNASWAIGEIAVRLGASMNVYAAGVVAALVALLNQPNLNRSLLENCSITIGRLALVCPEQVAPYLGEFIRPWCMAMRNIRDDLEKEHAFRGVCALVRLNSQGVVDNFVYLCDAFASWSHEPADLHAMFSEILHGFKASQGGDWAAYFATYPVYLQGVLSEKYQL